MRRELPGHRKNGPLSPGDRAELGWEDMGRDWKQWAADKGIDKWFRKDNLIILVLVGILLVVIALPTKDGGEGDKPEAQKSTLTLGELDAKSGGGAVSPGEGGDEAYAAYLEARLTETLSQIADVGKVKVMITLKSSQELVLEKEESVSRSSTDEEDSQGGKRVVSQTDSREAVVYRTDGSLSEPYVVKTLAPKIEGVLVVAEGAGNGTINRTIAEIAQALFGIDAHKVMVVKMDSIYYSEGSYNEVAKQEEGNESEKPN